MKGAVAVLALNRALAGGGGLGAGGGGLAGAALSAKARP